MFLDSQRGSVFVVSIELHSLPQDVYNIDVHGEHVYRVGNAAILVHNSNPLCDEYWDLKTRKNKGETVDEARLAELERIVGSKGRGVDIIGDPIDAVRRAAAKNVPVLLFEEMTNFSKLLAV